MTEKQIRHLEENVYKFSSGLSGALEILGSKASEILGYEVKADICNGEEIEFRKMSEDGYVDADSCIRMEEIIKKLKCEYYGTMLYNS